MGLPRRYHLHTRASFERLYGARELVVMVHGMRNDRAGAADKFEIARRRLKELGYAHPVVGYSYDSDARGAHLKSTAARALAVGNKIARRNGAHLAGFLSDFGHQSPQTRLRLIGHSLGSQVIMSAVGHLSRSHHNRDCIESIHLFGASVCSRAPSEYRALLRMVVRGRITNYYSPTDEVLQDAAGCTPLGLEGAAGRTGVQYQERLVRPKNHRFRSYAAVLRSFP